MKHNCITCNVRLHEDELWGDSTYPQCESCYYLGQSRIKSPQRILGIVTAIIVIVLLSLAIAGMRGLI